MFGLSIMSAVKVISYDAATQGLVANPLPAYAALRNGTLANDTAVRMLAPGAQYTPPLGEGEGAAVDILMAVNVPRATNQSISFEVQVLAVLGGGTVNTSSKFEVGATSLQFNVSAADQNTGVRQGTVTMRMRAEGPRTTVFLVLKGEGVVSLRVLVDRSVVEVFVQGGRASAVARDYNGAVEETHVHITNTNTNTAAAASLEIRNLAVHSMGCGWL